MSDTVDIMVEIALFVMVALLLPASWRALRGPTIMDRVLAIDLITTFLIGIMVLLAYVVDDPILVDLGLALAALSFVGNLAVARYVSEGRVF